MTFDATGAAVGYTGQIGGSVPDDVAINADGSLIYTAGADGNIRVYSADTGDLVQTIAIGGRLGGIDISPDGSFLMVTALDPLQSTSNDSNWTADQATVTAYKVDLSTNEVTSYPTTVTGDEWAFYDVAILANGNVLLSEQILPGWSGWENLKELDLSTGQYTVATQQTLTQNPVLSEARDGSYVFVGETNISDARVDMYQSGVGISASHALYADNVEGFNGGIQAFSSEAGLAVQYVGGNGLHVYDEQLHYETNLFTLYPALNGAVTGLAFDAGGQYLYVLDSATDTIIKLSTADWSTVGTISVGFDIADPNASFGNSLIVGPNERYFMISTNHGLFEVNNPAVSSTITGTAGGDDLTGTGLFDQILGDGGDDTIHGLGGNDILSGGDGNDILDGGAGNDRLDGGAGNDQLIGGAGSDTADYRAATGGITVDLRQTGAQNTGGAGTDTLSSIENVDGSAYNDTITGDDNANRLTGGAGNDVLHGGNGDDDLNGGSGDDTLDGGGGVNTVSYFGSTAGVHVSLAVIAAQDTGGAGIDTLTSFSNLTGSNFADSLTGSSGNNVLLGQGGDDSIVAGAGNDALDGGAGADAMSGGTGNDRYFVDNSGDTVVENAGEGTDSVQSSVSFTLGDNVENLTLVGAGAINGSGNAVDNVIDGNDQANKISGFDGNDTLRGNGGDDTLNGGAGNDIITGGDGNDVLVGGAGADTLDGGNGSDIYIYASTSERVGTEITDRGTSGTDELRFAASTASSLTLTSERGLERVVIGTGTGPTADTSGTIALGIDASAIANALTIIGNDGANTIRATAYADTLTGGAGDDHLFGNGGNDVLDGGTGADRMYGGVGNDTYRVDNASDFIGENASEGVDLVLASVSYTLRANVENLTLTGADNLNGKGNELANVVIGNDGANSLYGMAGNDKLYGGAGNDHLDGGTGADRMYGGAGNDTYVVDSASDYVVEDAGQGIDSVYSSVSYSLRANVERLTLTGTANINGAGNEIDNVLTGNGGANTLHGYDGNDVLSGGAGADMLDGGSGNDNLLGGADNDKIYGGDGADTLNGGDGNDWIEGGAGRDVLTGGTGADSFVFREGDFAGMTASTCDRIVDFSQSDADHIRLNYVDADATLAGDQAFTFVGTNAFSGTAGELRYEEINGNTYVSGDTNGDGSADFMIRIDGLHTLTTHDFVL